MDNMQPIDILTELVKECGYSIIESAVDEYGARLIHGPFSGWNRIRVGCFDIVNRSLMFTIAIKNDGEIWCGRASRSHDMRLNIHHPDSIKTLQDDLITMREEHVEAHTRSGQTQ